MRKKNLFVFLSCISFLALTGCGGTSSGSKPSDDGGSGGKEGDNGGNSGNNGGQQDRGTFVYYCNDYNHWKHYENGEEVDREPHAYVEKVDENEMPYYVCSVCEYTCDIYDYYIEDDHYSLAGVKNVYDKDGKRNVKKVVVSATHNNKPVTRINDSSFWERNIEEVEFEEGSRVTYIGSGSFFNNKFTSIKLPESVKEIGFSAFRGNKFASLYIPESVEEIGSEAFEVYGPIYTPLTVAPSGWADFIGPDHVTSVVFGKSKADITVNGMDFVINESEGTAALAQYKGEDSIVKIPDKVSKDGTEYTVNQLLTYAISMNDHVEHVVIPETVTEIRDSALFNLFNLKTVYIPNSVETLYSPVSYTRFEVDDEVPFITFYVGPNSDPTGWSDDWAKQSTYYWNVVRGVTNAPEITDYFTYYEGDDGIIIAKIHAGENVSKLEIPEKVDEKSVVEISSYAMIGNETIKELTLPSSLLKIGTRAFSSCALEKVTFAEDSVLKEIEENAFFYCKKLNSINLPNTVESIGENAFSSCYDLEEINLGEKLTSLGRYAFTSCYSLKAIKIPASLEVIPYACFENCHSLMDVVISKGVKKIGDMAFCNCPFLSIYIPASVEEFGYNWALSSDHSESYIEEYKNSDDYHPNGIFTSTQNIEDNRVLYIENESQYITGITCHAQVNGVSMANIVSGDFTFYIQNEKVVLQSYKGEGGDVVIPNTIEVNDEELPVTIIGENVFKDNETINSVTLPNKLEEIRQYAFCHTSISSIEFPNTLQKIDSDAFYNNLHLTKVVIPESVTNLSSSAFGFDPLRNEDGATIVDSQGHPVYPGNVTVVFVGEKPDYYYYPRCVKVYEHMVDVPFTKGDLIYAPIGDNEVMLYGHTGGDEPMELGDVVIPASIENGNDTYKVVKVFDEALRGCVIKSLSLPNTIKEIGRYAFYGTESTTILTEIDLSGCVNLVSIGDCAFRNNVNVETILLPNGLQTIGSDCFGNNKVVEITIPSTVVSIGIYAFSDCSKLTTVVITSEYIEIGGYAFADDYSLNNSGLTLPDTAIVMVEAFYHTSVTGISYSFAGTLSQLRNKGITNEAKVIIKYDENPSKDDGNTMHAKELISYTNLTELVIQPGIVCEQACLYGTSKLVKLSMVFDKYLAYYFCKRNVNDYPDGYEPFDNTYTITQAISIVDGNNSRATTQSNLYLPSSLKEVVIYGGNANYDGSPFSFQNSTSLTSVSFSPSFTGTNIVIGCFKGCRFTSIDLPETIKTLGMEAFADSRVKRLVMPSSLLHVRRDCFARCTQLEEIRFQENFVWLEPRVFYNCSALYYVGITTTSHTWYVYDYHLNSSGNATANPTQVSNQISFSANSLADTLTDNPSYALLRDDYASVTN